MKQGDLSMINDLTFKGVCKFIEKDGKSLIDQVDKLLGMAIVLSPVVVGPHLLPLLGYITTKNELTKIGQWVVKKVTSKKEDNYCSRSERMHVAYGLICFTAFFEAIDQLMTDDIRNKINITKNEINYASREFADGVFLDEPLMFPHPTVSLNEEMQRIGKMYDQMAQGFYKTLIKLDVLVKTADGADKCFKTIIKNLPSKALECFEHQYTELALIYPDFCIWSQLHQHKTTQTALEKISIYLNQHATIFYESNNKIDIGFNILQEMVLAIPEQYKKVEAAHIVEGLKKHYDRRINDAIIEDEYDKSREKAALNFPKISEAFIPQSYRVIRQTTNDRHLEREENWAKLEINHDIGAFLISYLSSPYSIETPLLILGHPGSGKSVLTKVLSARLMSESFIPILVPLRKVNAELPIEDQIDYIINRYTGHRIPSWANFSNQFVDRPLLIILDGYDELLQVSGKVYVGYLNAVQQFQKREAEQGRPVRVIVTSRITLIDKTRIPDGSTVVRLLEFDEEQRNAWITVWNKANEHYFNTCNPPIKPFELPMEPKKGKSDKIILLAKQPLLLLMLAIYDSDKNNLRNHKNLDRTLLYDSLLRRFVERERRRYVQDFDLLEPKKRNKEIDHEMQRLGAVAVGMYNRRQLHILSSELNSDLEFFKLERKMNVTDGRPMTEADLLLGSFFFIHKSKSGHKEEENDYTEGNTAFEFLHNTFGEFLTADFILRAAFKVTEILHTFKQNESLFGEYEKKIQNLDLEWYACLMYAPLYSRPVVVEMIREWTNHVIKRTRCNRDEFLFYIDAILQSQIGIILKARVLPLSLNNNTAQFTDIPLMGHVAIYTLNLIILRTILDNKEFIFDECCYGSVEEGGDPDISGTRPWDKLAYIWRSWFPLESLNGLSAILAARRENSKIILNGCERVLSIPSDDRIKNVLNVALTLADNITSGLVGLISCNSVEIRRCNYAKIEKQLITENIHLRLEFIVRNLRHLLLTSQVLDDINELVFYGFREIFKSRLFGGLVIAEFIDLVGKAMQHGYLSVKCEVELESLFDNYLFPGYFREILDRQPEVAIELLNLARKLLNTRFFDRFTDAFFENEFHPNYFGEIIMRQPKIALEFMRLAREHSFRLYKRYIDELLETPNPLLNRVIDVQPEVAVEILRLLWHYGSRHSCEPFIGRLLENAIEPSYFRRIMKNQPDFAIEFIYLAQEVGNRNWIVCFNDMFFKYIGNPENFRQILNYRTNVMLKFLRLAQEFGNNHWIESHGVEFLQRAIGLHFRNFMGIQLEVVIELLRLLKGIDKFHIESFFEDFIMHIEQSYFRRFMEMQPEGVLEFLRLLIEFGNERLIDRFADTKLIRYVSHHISSRGIMEVQPKFVLEFIRFVRKVSNNSRLIEFTKEGLFEHMINMNIGIMPLEYLGDIEWYAEITNNDSLMKKIHFFLNNNLMR